MFLWQAVRTMVCRHGEKARGFRARMSPVSVTVWVSMAARSWLAWPWGASRTPRGARSRA